jgi:hypothetical protein
VLFVHIPKAAGSTVTQIIRRVYAGRNVRYVVGSPDAIGAFVAEPEIERHDVDVLYGHLYFALHESLRSPSRVVTILRNSIDRTLSLYHYIRREPKHRLHDVMGDATLDEFVESTSLPELDNDQVRRLADAPGYEVPIGKVTCEHLELALSRLHRDDVIFGLAERFEDSLALMSSALNWPAVAYQSINVSQRPRGEIPAGILDRIRERNQYDDTLYSAAVDLFEQRCKARAPFS